MHGFSVKRNKPWQAQPGGRVIELSTCPFNSEHTSGSAAFTVINGRLGFCCKHNGCQGKTMKDVFAEYPAERSVRAALTEGWPTPIPFNQINPEPIPTSCLPGWLGEMASAVA